MWVRRTGTPPLFAALEPARRVLLANSGWSRTSLASLRTSHGKIVSSLGGVDAVILVDGGTDILLRGDESRLGTPAADVTVDLAALADRCLYLDRLEQTPTFRRIEAQIEQFRSGINRRTPRTCPHQTGTRGFGRGGHASAPWAGPDAQRSWKMVIAPAAAVFQDLYTWVRIWAVSGARTPPRAGSI